MVCGHSHAISGTAPLSSMRICIPSTWAHGFPRGSGCSHYLPHSLCCYFAQRPFVLSIWVLSACYKHTSLNDRPVAVPAHRHAHIMGLMLIARQTADLHTRPRAVNSAAACIAYQDLSIHPSTVSHPSPTSFSCTYFHAFANIPLSHPKPSNPFALSFLLSQADHPFHTVQLITTLHARWSK